MTPAQSSPFGSWISPITSDLIISESIGLGQIVLDSGSIYWVEVRPSEGGRHVIRRRSPAGGAEDITQEPYSVRTRVHEYGGGAFTVSGEVVFFANFVDQRLYRQDAGQDPRPITPEGPHRYADFINDGKRGQLISVREDHSDDHAEPVNSLVVIPANGTGEITVLQSGSDFYSSPRLSPDGTMLAWLAWNHPNMPWDGTELWMAEVGYDGRLVAPRIVAGGPEESIAQPEWSPEGVLHFVSDRTGWWNLYRVREGRPEPLLRAEAEFGRPQWVFGAATYGFDSDGNLVCAFNERGRWNLGILESEAQEITPLDTPYIEIGRGDLRVSGGVVLFEAGSPRHPMSLVQLDLKTRDLMVLCQSFNLALDPGYISQPQTIEFPTERGLTAYAYYYAPQNCDFAPPDGERPPLLVKSHGGPTGAASAALDLQIQFWTSRGFAVVDVNYGGSSGYGREYRKRLEGQWGIVDVEDCVNAARYLVEEGLVDPGRLAIDGGSAGGFTTLAALTFNNVFSAGASYYGVSDLEALARDTHKFESRYLDRLIGSYPEEREVYLARSPINFTDQLSCPLILFQGLEDRIVPPDQAEKMFEAVRRKGLPTAYLPFEGEQHGFRRGENIKRALDAELYFYSRVFSFGLADPVEPVHIENLSTG